MKTKLITAAIFILLALCGLHAQVTKIIPPQPPIEKKLPPSSPEKENNIPLPTPLLENNVPISPPDQSYNVTPMKKLHEPGIDLDMDGIDDITEHDLLQRFSPFYLFADDDGDEEFRPTDIYDYIRQSRLLNSDEEEDPNAVVIQNNELFNNPESVLFSIPTSVHPTTSNINSHPEITDYYIDPDDNGAKGKEWIDCELELNVGLYGHVVPFIESTPQTDFVSFGLDPSKVYYKIEYWQFFGYNGLQNDINKALGDHEGDWTTVQLIYSPEDDDFVKVFFYVHGNEFRYDVPSTINTAMIYNQGILMKEYQGPQYHFNPDIDFEDFSLTSENHYTHSSDFWQTQNNVVRFFRDPCTGKFDHPVVYLEKGTHEFYPSPYWNYPKAPNHNGESQYKFLSSFIPNLGEVENPLNECRGASIILQYNGKWGAHSSVGNDPGPGPCYHQQWLWPANSSIRWRLPKDLGF